jgi:lipoprotein-anchoring transpeptidase ErfK/SrfK
MKDNFLSRRDFLKLSGLSISSITLQPLLLSTPQTLKPPGALGLTRVTVEKMKVFNEPSYESEIVHWRQRDELIYVYEKFESPEGPDFNPRWYRINEGYAHTAYLQPVETHLNDVVYEIPETGRLAEVTVPISLSFRYTDFLGWQPLYRLYYKSVHWITDVGYGPNNQVWYQITDELLKVNYHVLARHMRLIKPEELTPVSTDVPPEKKKVLVDRQTQRLYAFEYDEVVFETDVSTGMLHRPTKNGPSLKTPEGKFHVQLKMPVRHMGDGQLTNDVNAYELPGVPWVAYFYKTGVAFHGTYWHDNYGNEMSHGCVNMRPEEAKWLWRWLTPEIEFTEWQKGGLGTSVEVI